jgi:hypothetical protein
VDAYQMGERALHRLLRHDQGEPAPSRSHEVLPTWLVVRASCGASPIDGRRAGDPRPAGAPAAPGRKRVAAARPRRRERDK